MFWLLRRSKVGIALSKAIECWSSHDDWWFYQMDLSKLDLNVIRLEQSEATTEQQQQWNRNWPHWPWSEFHFSVSRSQLCKFRCCCSGRRVCFWLNGYFSLSLASFVHSWLLLFCRHLFTISSHLNRLLRQFQWRDDDEEKWEMESIGVESWGRRNCCNSESAIVERNRVDKVILQEFYSAAVSYWHQKINAKINDNLWVEVWSRVTL